MLKSILLVSTLLVLMGCSGGEFYSAGEYTAPTAGTAGSGSEAGQTSDAGETSSGGTEGLGASGGKGGDQAGSGGTGGSTGGTEGLGGDGPTPMGGSSNTAGTAGTGGTDTIPDPICTPNAGRCTNLNFEVCSKDGLQWVKQETCSSVCSTTGCKGDCKPGSSKCDGLNSMSCNEEGKWIKTSTCPFICSGAGECKGSCLPGQKFCDGKTTQTCDDTGELVNGEVCPNLCSAGACTGACTPGVKQCNGKISQECLANGSWKDTACSYVCGGAGVCGGECVPGTKKCSGDSIQTCNPQGEWQTEASCPFICSNGACGGICKPNQNCGDDGNECTQEVCSSDGLSCTHPIKVNATPCGSQTNTECNKPDTCQAGVCKSNFSLPTTSCTPDTNTCTVDSCDGAGSCSHKAGNSGAVCRASTCTNGQIVSEGKCDGVSTTCSAATKSDCFGPCNSQSLTCEMAQPQKVADAYTMLATDNDPLYLYASVRNDSGTAQILRIQKSDGAQTILYQDNSGSLWIYAMILAGKHLYLGETNKVTRIDTTADQNPQTPTFIQGGATFGFAKNSDRVYWSDASQQACDCASPQTHRVYSTPINGNGAVAPFGLNFANEDLSPDIEVTDTDLYVWEMTSHSPGLYHPSLTRYNLTNPATNATGLIAGSFQKNGTVQTTSGVTTMPGLTKNGTHVFANTESEIGTTIFSVNISNYALTLLATDNQVAASFNFVADAQSVYLSNEKVAVTGGSFSYTSAHSLAGPSTLTLDGTHLYFGSYGYYTAPPYTFNVDVPLKSFFKTAK